MLKIALKNNVFDDEDVELNIDIFNRDQVARVLESTAVPLDITEGIGYYEGNEQIVKYLREHPDQIVSVRKGTMTQYCLYRPHLHPKNVPTMRIVEVDETKPWMIDRSSGFELPAYIRQMPNNQHVLVPSFD